MIANKEIEKMTQKKNKKGKSWYKRHQSIIDNIIAIILKIIFFYIYIPEVIYEKIKDYRYKHKKPIDDNRCEEFIKKNFSRLSSIENDDIYFKYPIKSTLLKNKQKSFYIKYAGEINFYLRTKLEINGYTRTSYYDYDKFCSYIKFEKRG